MVKYLTPGVYVAETGIIPLLSPLPEHIVSEFINEINQNLPKKMRIKLPLVDVTVFGCKTDDNIHVMFWDGYVTIGAVGGYSWNYRVSYDDGDFITKAVALIKGMSGYVTRDIGPPPPKEFIEKFGEPDRGW